MSWKKYFRVVNTPTTSVDPKRIADSGSSGATTSAKFSSFLPEVYAGHPHRIQRYYQFDDMDNDVDIATALDIIADFCTQSEQQTDEPFLLHFEDDATEAQVSTLKKAMNRWIKLNDFRSKLYQIFRETLKFGDQFFLRDPQTGEWLWTSHYMVEMVKLDDADGKTPEEYIIRGMDYNKLEKFGSVPVDTNQYRMPLGGNTSTLGGRQSSGTSSSPSSFSLSGSNTDPRARQSLGQTADQLSVVDAKHVIHMSLSVGMDPNFPFGRSILEAVFKPYKQKTLLEDAILIYRVMRAPERRVFKIDTAGMPPNKAAAYLAQVKNEIHQRRLPSRNGGGGSVLDAAFNPLAICDDYFFAVGENNRGSSVDRLEGGGDTGEITDLKYFSKALWRGMKIPPSYLSINDEASNSQYQDGKVGQALIQEFFFNKYCMRLQSLLSPTFDKEFKYFIMRSGIEIDESLFEIRLNPPQNFSQYRQIEIDAAQMNVYSQIAQSNKFSERFKQKRWLGLREEEILENERLYKEENADKVKKRTGSTPAEDSSDQGLSNVGVRSGDMDMSFGDGPEPGMDEPPMDGGPPPDGGGGEAPLPDAGPAPAGPSGPPPA